MMSGVSNVGWFVRFCFLLIYKKGNWGSRKDVRKVIFQTHLWMGQNVIDLLNEKGKAGWLSGLRPTGGQQGMVTVPLGRPRGFYHWRLSRGI